MARKPPLDAVRVPAPSAAGLVLVGRLGAPHGLRGAIRLQSFTQDPLAIASYGALTDGCGARRFVIASLRPGPKGVWVAEFEGVGDRAAAEALTNVGLYADRQNLPPPEAEEFYVSDLVGLVAVTPDGAAIGAVIDVQNFGAGDILEVRPVSGGETLLFPFTRAVVPHIDMPGRRLVVAPPREIEGEPAVDLAPRRGL